MILQFNASAILMMDSTAFSLTTGSDPGKPKHIGHVCVFGGADR